MKLDTLFYSIGLFISNHPVKVIIVSISIMTIILSGLMFLEFETDPQKLWVAQDSKTNYEQIFSNKKFGAFFRIEQFILRADDDNDMTDLFQKEYLQMIYELQSRIEKGTVQYNNRTYGLNEFCYRPIADQGCYVSSPMDFWQMNLIKMLQDPDIKETAKCLKKTATKDLPCFDRIGTPIQIDAVFGKLGCENGEVNDDCNLCRRTARGLAVTFLLNSNSYTNDVAALWEKEVFEAEVLRFREQLNSAKIKFVKDDNAPNNIPMPKLRIDYLAERSVTDELDVENKQNIWIVIASYLLMFVYISIAMGEFPSIYLSRVLVGLGGILVVILSFLGSVAFVSIFGIKLSLISSEVVPFLVLAIGVDNMFIITGAKDRKSRKLEEMHQAGQLAAMPTLNELIALTLKEVGPSITTAAFSEFLAFIVGYSTNIPALQSFCLCAAFAVLLDYILQVTLFLAIVTLDDIRVKDGRYDICPCFKVPENKRVQRSKGKVALQRFFSVPYYDFLMKPPVQITVGVLYIGFLIISAIGITQFPLGLNQQTTVVQHSDLFNYFRTQESYVDAGPPAYLIFYNIDYNNSTNLQILDELLDNISILSTVKPPVYSWYKDFKKFMDPSGDWSAPCNPNLNYLLTLPLEIQVREFLKMKIDDKCCTEYAVCGEPYVGDIFFGDNGQIEASRFRFQHIPLTNQTVYVESMIQTKVVSEDYSNKFSTYNNKSAKANFIIDGKPVDVDTVYPYSLFYVYYDQYTTIRAMSIQNIIIALAAIFLAVQLIMNIKSAAVVTLFVLSCVFNLIGVLWLLNFIPDYIIELNAVSVVNLVCACGLSVEFTVHLIIFYIRSPKENPKDKVRYALRNVGASVFIGIVTTKIIGVTVLLFAPSKVFQIYYFRMYFFLIIMGFFHGFMVLPIFLSYVNIKKRLGLTHPHDEANKSLIKNQVSFDNVISDT